MSKAGAVPDYRKKGNAFFDFFSYEAFRPKMSPVDLINHIGPDFMSNKFDAFFVWRGADGSLKPLNHFDMPSLLDIDASTNGELLLPDVKPYTASTEEASTHYMKQILSRYGFAVRLSSVTIPAQHHEEFSTPFLETNVSRIRSTRAYSNESKFALRMDQDLLWLDAMQKLAGRNITYDVFISNGLNEVNPWYDATTLRTFEETFRTVSSSWSRATLSSEEKPVDVKSTRLSLIVRITQLSNIVNVYWQDKRPPFFVFDDVKFLGPSDGIHYSRENADTQDVEFGFIFKRLYKVSPSYVAQKSNSFVYNTASNIPVIPQMGGALTGDDKYKISTGLETKDIALEDS
jgi:hypothetical protein